MPGPRRATDAMHVVFQLLRHVIVDHIANLVDVKAARCHIGGHEHPTCSARLELLEDGFSHLLRLISMDALHTLKPLTVELLDEVVNTFLGLAEDDGARL